MNTTAKEAHRHSQTSLKSSWDAFAEEIFGNVQKFSRMYGNQDLGEGMDWGRKRLRKANSYSIPSPDPVRP